MYLGTTANQFLLRVDTLPPKKNKKEKGVREMREGFAYMINNLMSNPPVVLQQIITLRAHRFRYALCYWL